MTSYIIANSEMTQTNVINDLEESDPVNKQVLLSLSDSLTLFEVIQRLR